jgi:hypothetical protein
LYWETIEAHRRLRNHRNLLPPLGLFLALLIGRVLARGDFVEGAPLRSIRT